MISELGLTRIIHDWGEFDQFGRFVLIQAQERK
jgi:hypothetical protein